MGEHLMSDKERRTFLDGFRPTPSLTSGKVGVENGLRTTPTIKPAEGQGQQTTTGQKKDG
jgi:hypothetical protein